MSAFLRFASRCSFVATAKAAPRHNGSQTRTAVSAKPLSTDVGANRLVRDDNNVLHSPFPTVTGYKNAYVHDVIWKNLDKWPDKIATISAETGKAYTYHQLRELCGRFATTLRKMKILPGDTIAVILPNVPEYPIPMLGASEAGVRITLLNPNYSVGEIAKLLIDSETTAVVTIRSKYNDIKKSIDGNPKIRFPIVVIDDGTGPVPEDCIRFEDLINDHVEAFHLREKTDVDFEDTVVLPFSSGTAGLPKGVELSHRNIVANILQVADKNVSIAEEATANYQQVVPLVLPAFHIYGMAFGFYQQLRIGGKVVCMIKFTLPSFLKVLEEHEASILYLVPPIIQLMGKSPAVKSHHVRAVKQITSGAAPLGKEAIALFQERTGHNISFAQGYGLTEASPAVCFSRIASPESVGCPVPNTQVRIVGTEEDKRQNLGANKIGELHIKGPQIMKGYFKNPQATADSMDGDWYKTGDLAKYDEIGQVYIQGRLKELIKVKGFQVAPAELEDILRAHDKVADAAVIGIPHEIHGEVPKAFIVPKSGVTIHPDEIMGYVAKRVAKFKRLGEVQFIGSIPKSPAGKILMRELKKIKSQHTGGSGSNVKN